MSLSLLRAAVVASALVAAASASALEWPGRTEAAMDAYSRANEPQARADAILTLASVDPSAAVDVLRVALTDRAPEVREAACTTLGDIGAIELQSEVLGRLSDRSSVVRAAAARAIGELRIEDSSAPVARLLADRDSDVRVAAVEALTRLGSTDAVIAISNALGDRSREVVVAALEALGSLGQPGTVYAVLEKATDPSEEVALAAVDALVELRSDAAVGTLVELVGTGRATVALAAIDGLGRLAAAEGTPALVAEVISPRVSGARVAALTALIELGSKDGLEALLPMLASDPAVVAPYFASVGVDGWDAFYDVAQRLPDNEVLDPTLLGAWLSSGDSRALDHVNTDEQISAMLRMSPTPEAFCRAMEGDMPWSELDLVEVSEWAVESGALNCFRPVIDARSPLGTEEAAEIAGNVAGSDPVLALELLEAHVSSDSMPWSSAAPLAASATQLGPAGVSVLESLAFSTDSRVRHEAVAGLLDTAETVPSRILDGLSDPRTRRSEWVALLGIGVAAGQDSARSLASQLTSDHDAQVRSAALGALAQSCAASPSTLSGAIEDESYWVRRAAYQYGVSCGSVRASEDEFDPIARRLRFPETASSELLEIAADVSSPDYLRVAAIRELGERGDTEGVEALKRSRSELVAAAAWLSVEDPRPALDVALSGIAVTRSLERAAIFETLDGQLESSMVEHALRREDDANTLRILTRAAPHGSVVVYLVDVESGYPRQDEDVFFIFADGTFDVARADAQGLVVVNRDDIRSVFVR